MALKVKYDTYLFLAVEFVKFKRKTSYRIIHFEAYHEHDVL